MVPFFNLILIVACSFSILSCGNSSSKDKSSSPVTDSKSIEREEVEGIDGTYTFSDNSAKLEILIMGDAWSGKTIMISGFGADYDNKQAQYENGVVKGNDLYDSSGLIKIGSVNGKSLSTSVAGQSVTLRK
jgi:hypothetical protein